MVNEGGNVKFLTTWSDKTMLEHDKDQLSQNLMLLVEAQSWRQ